MQVDLVSKAFIYLFKSTFLKECILFPKINVQSENPARQRQLDTAVILTDRPP